jgi:hypothetical protein
VLAIAEEFARHSLERVGMSGEIGHRAGLRIEAAYFG